MVCLSGYAAVNNNCYATITLKRNGTTILNDGLGTLSYAPFWCMTVSATTVVPVVSAGDVFSVTYASNGLNSVELYLSIVKLN